MEPLYTAHRMASMMRLRSKERTRMSMRITPMPIVGSTEREEGADRPVRTNAGTGRVLAKQNVARAFIGLAILDGVLSQKAFDRGKGLAYQEHITYMIMHHSVKRKLPIFEPVGRLRRCLQVCA